MTPGRSNGAALICSAQLHRVRKSKTVAVEKKCINQRICVRQKYNKIKALKDLCFNLPLKAISHSC